jgi:hypothetical protein
MLSGNDMFSPLPGTGSDPLPLLNVLQENRKQYAFFALLQLFFSVYSIFQFGVILNKKVAFI